jgi:hypothetical protein
MLGVFDYHLFSLKQDRARILFLDPGQYLDESGLACAVLSHYGVDLAALQEEIYV